MNFSFQKMIYLLEIGILRDWMIPFSIIGGDSTSDKSDKIISMTV